MRLMRKTMSAPAPALKGSLSMTSTAEEVVAFFPVQHISSKLHGIQVPAPFLLPALFPELEPKDAGTAAAQFLPKVGSTQPVLVQMQVVSHEQQQLPSFGAAAAGYSSAAAASEVLHVELWAQFRPPANATTGNQRPERYSLRGPVVTDLVERYSGHTITGVTAGPQIEATLNCTTRLSVIQLLLAAPGVHPQPMQLQSTHKQQQSPSQQQLCQLQHRQATTSLNTRAAPTVALPLQASTTPAVQERGTAAVAASTAAPKAMSVTQAASIQPLQAAQSAQWQAAVMKESPPPPPLPSAAAASGPSAPPPPPPPLAATRAPGAPAGAAAGAAAGTPLPAAAALPEGFSLPDFDSAVAAEAMLWKLLGEHLQADDDVMERAEAALSLLTQPAAGADNDAKLQRFTADYASLQQWVRRRRLDKVWSALNKLLDNALA